MTSNPLDLGSVGSRKFATDSADSPGATDLRVAAGPGIGLRKSLLAYLELTKPRIVLLVLLTGVPALLLAARGFPELETVAGAVLGTALAAASAAAFNHVLDRDIDAVMLRTRRRPLPAGTLTPAQGLVFAFVLAGLSWVVLDAWTNRLAAIVGLASIVYYAVVYTVWLKRATPQNIVIGGGAGATAPLIAWAAVTGRIELTAIALAAIVFFWTPPHFWALALYRREDYARAGIPMLPVTHGEEVTRRQILLYTLALVPITLAPAAIGAAGLIYALPALALGAAFAWFAWKLWRTRETARAVRLFRFSILYLFALFVALGTDAAVGGWKNRQGAVAARAAAAQAVAAVQVPLTVTFAARTVGDVPVKATPLSGSIDVRRGATSEVSYRFVNASDDTVEFGAIHRVTPAAYDSLFHKQVCFCFSRQTLAPRQVADLPVRFVVDPRLPAGVSRLALDYSIIALP
jgi:protoheme IX farnesyltransferase